MKRSISLLSFLIPLFFVSLVYAAMNDWTVGNKIRIEQLLKHQKPLVVVVLEGGLLDTADRGEEYLEYLLKRGPIRKLNDKDKILQEYKDLLATDDIAAQKYFSNLLVDHKASAVAHSTSKYFRKRLKNKIHPKVKILINTFTNNGFDVYLVSSQPRYLALEAAEEIDLDKDYVIGVQNVIIGGKLTAKLQEPIPVNSSAINAIKNITDRKPSVVIGSSDQDRHLLSYSEHLTIVINPDSPTRQVASTKGWVTQFFNR
ncbi:haloacid dehalogenase-like hydrolase [Bdellovibrionota bacterium]